MSRTICVYGLLMSLVLFGFKISPGPIKIKDGATNNDGTRSRRHFRACPGVNHLRPGALQGCFQLSLLKKLGIYSLQATFLSIVKSQGHWFVLPRAPAGHCKQILASMSEETHGRTCADGILQSKSTIPALGPSPYHSIPAHPCPP